MMKSLFWFIGDNPHLWKIHEGKPWSGCYIFLKIFESILRGFAQVCFANNSFSGLVIFAALLLADPIVGLAALLASSASLLMSKILGQPDAIVVAGLQNYSAVLVGSVTAALFPIFFEGSMTGLVWMQVAVMAAFSVCLALGLSVLLAPNKLPVYTLPFNLTTSLLFLSFQASGFFVEASMAPLSTNSTEGVDWLQLLNGIVKSSGQVYAVDNTIASVLILFALVLNSPILTLFSFVGGIFSSLVGLGTTSAPYSAIYAGIWGYNGFLAAGCISFFVTPSRYSFVIAVLNVIFTALIQAGLNPIFKKIHLPIFTFPFCFSSLIFLALIEAVPSLERVKELTFPEQHYCKARDQRKNNQVN